MRKSFRSGHSREHKTKRSGLVPIGTLLGIHDKNGAELYAGDYVLLYFNGKVNQAGRLLYDRTWYSKGKYGYLCRTYSIWYPPFDEFNHNSYGKEDEIPMDDSWKPDIERVASYEEKDIWWDYDEGRLRHSAYWKDGVFQIKLAMNVY